MRWLAAFAVTQLVEVPIYGSALREQRGARRWLIAFAASAITHPVVWFVFPELGLGSWYATVAAAELFAVLAEWGWLRAFGLRRALLWAILANASSVAVGLVLRELTGWP